MIVYSHLGVFAHALFPGRPVSPLPAAVVQEAGSAVSSSVQLESLPCLTFWQLPLSHFTVVVSACLSPH